MSKEQNFERTLPEGYKQALYINAKQAKFGIIFNLIALVVLAVVMVLAVLALRLSDRLMPGIMDMEPTEMLVAYFVFIAVMIAYVVLHELVHGIAYKTLTGEKLTFGISWSCAFCGVPHIYSYRKTAIISSAAPLVLFSSIFGAITVLLYFVSPIYYLLSAILLGLHLGGCSGDMYIILMLLRYSNSKVLMRDTGPEQFIYIPN